MALLSGENGSLECEIVSLEKAGVVSPERLAVLKAIAREPKYPAEIARELGMRLQAVYYHVKLLEQNGFIELAGQEAKRGAVAKKFIAKSKSFAFPLSGEWKSNPVSKAKIPALFSSFSSHGVLDAKFVLGSPEPHGKYRSRGSELCACEISMFLGSFSSFSFPLFYLDTEITDAVKKSNNLIALGGPKVNTLVDELNKFLPIKFEERTFGLYSSLSGKHYSEDVGVLEIIDSPFARGKKIMVAAGLTHFGTRVAVLSLLQKTRELEKGNFHDSSKIAKVVQGFDENGDGIVDAVEILE